MLCGVRGAARYPATGLATEQGAGGEPREEPTGFGTQVPFEVGTSRLAVLDVSPECWGTGAGGGGDGVPYVRLSHPCPLSPPTPAQDSGSRLLVLGPHCMQGSGEFRWDRQVYLDARRLRVPTAPAAGYFAVPPASALSPSGRSRPFQRLPAPCGPALSRQPGSPPCRPPPSVLPVKWGWPCRNGVLEREFILGSGCPSVSASVPPTYGAHQLQPWMEASRGT